MIVLSAPSPQGERPRLAVVTVKGFGDAVDRNRARRRLRAAFAAIELPPEGLDLILTARTSARSVEFKLLCEDLRAALGRL